RGRGRCPRGILLMNTTMVQGSQPEVHLIDYWRLLVRRRWIVFAVLAAVLTGVGVRTFRATPLYRGTATIQIERSDPNIMKFQEVMAFDPSFLSYQDFYQTQYKLLESEAVARRAVHQLALAKDPDFLHEEPPGLLSRVWTSL